jgi:hypothetical protein
MVSLGPPPLTPPDARRWPRIEAGLTVALVLGAVAGLAWHCHYLSVPVVDDAAISLAYGRTFFGGDGLRATPSSQPVEGFSNLLWTLLLGLSRPLRLEPLSYMKVLGIGFGMLALPAFALWGPAAEQRRLRLEDAVGPLIAALNPTYAYWISSGMESGIQAFLLGLSGAFVLRELRTGGSAHAGWALGLLCLTRPEGVLFAAAAGALWVVSRALGRRWPGRQELRIGAWLVALVGGWLVLRWLYFADWLPNTYYAKSTWDFRADTYFQGFWETYQGLCRTTLLGLVLGLLGGWALLRRTVLTALFLGCGMLFVHIAMGDWMAEWRFFAPLIPVMGMATAAGFTGIRNLGRWLQTHASLGRRINPVWAWRVAAGVLAAALFEPTAHASYDSIQRAPFVKSRPNLPYDYIAGLFRQTRAQTDSLGQFRPLLAYPDMGGQAMVMRNAEILDVAGLCDYAIAHHSGNLAAREDYLLSEGLPILLDVHGPSDYMGQFSRLLAQFHPIGGPFLMLNGLTPTEDPRCPEGKVRTLAMDAKELAGHFEQEIQQDRAPDALRRWRCVFAYKELKQLPARDTLHQLANLAGARGDALVREGKLEPALRQYSLATLLDDGNAHRRRKTEKLRARVFPPPPKP